MTQNKVRKPRTPKEGAPKWQTHVYLDESDFKLLVAVATKECRSATNQITYFIRKGLEAYRVNGEDSKR